MQTGLLARTGAATAIQTAFVRTHTIACIRVDFRFLTGLSHIRSADISGLGSSTDCMCRAGGPVGVAAARGAQRQPCAAQTVGSASPREAGSCRCRRHAAPEATARERDTTAGPA